MKKMILILAGLALLGAACKSSTTTVALQDDSDNAAASADNPDPAPDDAGDQPTTAPIDAPEPEAPAETPTEPPAPTVDTSAPGADVGSDDWCTVAAAVEENFDELDLVAFGDPEALERVYRQASAMITQAQRLAPPIIAADVAKTIEGVQFLIDVLEEADWNFLNLDPSVLDPIGNDLEISGYNIQKYNFDVCNIGDDPGEPPVFDDPPPSTDDGVPPATGTIGEQAVAGLVEAGFTPEEAQCLLDQINFTDPEAFTDTAKLFEVFTDCGISLDRLSQLGG